MKHLTFIFIWLLITPGFCLAQDRYLASNKIIYEDPQEQDILMVNTTVGYTTVLEFPERPSMVTTGDSSLLQIEVPKNSKNVLIKPLRVMGETNLFVFTPQQRFNYKVVVGDKTDVDYVIDVKEPFEKNMKGDENLSFNQLLRMAQDYESLNRLNLIDKRTFFKRDINKQYDSAMISMKIMEVFVNKFPHSIFLHAMVHNNNHENIILTEKATNVYVNGQKFKPRFVLFDATTLEPGQEMDVWLVLKDTFISLSNEFTIGMGVYGKEYIF